MRGARLTFERLVHFAAEAFDVPIATVSLIEEIQQTYLTRYGLEFASTPRSVALCDRTVTSNRMTVALDTSLDAVWRDNPLVTGGP